MRSKALFGALGLVVALTAFPVMSSWAADPPPSPPEQSAPTAPADPAPAAADPAPAAPAPADPAPAAPEVADPAPAAPQVADPAPAAPEVADPAPAAPQVADPSPVQPGAGPTAAVVTPSATASVAAPSATAPSSPVPTSASPSGSASPGPTPSPSATPSPPAERSALTARQRLVLTGDSDHDGRADRGDRVRVVIVVTNSGGRVTLRSVRVVDSLFRRLGSPVTCGTSVLAPGASTSCGSGPVTVRRAQAKAGVLSNQARATARTPSGALVRSAASTATLQVQRPAHKHRHKHKHKHRQHRAKRHHHHQRVHQHRTRVKRVKPPSARLHLSQFVLKVVDVNKNGRLEAGDSVRFGFQVANTGTLSATGLHIVDRRLTRFKVSVVCAATTLGPGAETVCRSGPMVVTRYQAKKRLGQNFAYAAATAGGTSVRSNSTVIPLQRSTTALRRLTRLPNTGSSLTPSQLGLAGMLLMGGVFLLSAGRRRRPVVSRHRSSAPTDPR